MIYYLMIFMNLLSLRTIYCKYNGPFYGWYVAMPAWGRPNLVDNLIVLDIAPKDYSIQSRFDELINSVISLL